MRYKRIIGIDPGAHGALAFFDMERTANPVVHKTTDGLPCAALYDALNGVRSIDCVAYLERVGGFIAGKKLPGSSMFRMGESFGYWQGLLRGAGVRCVLVRPQDWQAGIAGTAGKKGADRKRALRAEAGRLFPDMKVTLDTCDALLIADYARRVEAAGR